MIDTVIASGLEIPRIFFNKGRQNPKPPTLPHCQFPLPHESTKRRHQTAPVLGACSDGVPDSDWVMVEGIRISRGGMHLDLLGGFYLEGHMNWLILDLFFLKTPENWDCTKMIRFLMAYLEDHLSGCK